MLSAHPSDSLRLLPGSTLGQELPGLNNICLVLRRTVFLQSSGICVWLQALFLLLLGIALWQHLLGLRWQEVRAVSFEIFGFTEC